LRAKYEQLRTVIDPESQKPVADYLGGSYWGLRTFDNGFRRFNFDNGDIASYDHSGRYPIVCVYGPIFKFYDMLGGAANSALGRPLSDVRDLPDGSRCAVFEGGHLHQWADKVEPYVFDILLSTGPNLNIFRLVSLKTSAQHTTNLRPRPSLLMSVRIRL
jgi:hypothetical protein